MGQNKVRIERFDFISAIISEGSLIICKILG